MLLTLWSLWDKVRPTTYVRTVALGAAWTPTFALSAVWTSSINLKAQD